MLLRQVAESQLIVRSRLTSPGFNLAGLSCDSRLVDGRTGFFALRGLREDGHRFLEAARLAGAPAAFVTDPAWFVRAAAGGWEGLFLVEAGEARRAMAELAALLRGNPAERIRLFGVTGTNGKTTVSHLAAGMLEALGSPCGIIGSLGLVRGGVTVGSERTTPEAPEIQGFLAGCLDDGVESVVMEATSIGIALERTRGLIFRAAAFTNLTRDHLDFHGGMEAYKEAKFRLFLEHELEAAVINLDDPAGVELAARIRAERPGMGLLTYGFAAGADLRLEEPECGGWGGRAVLRYGGERLPLATRLLGRFNLSNLAGALGLLLAGGEEPAGLVRAASSLPPVAGRFERVELPLPFTVVVDYSHTPGALETALETARPLAGGELWVVFGCGGERDRGKRPLMGAIAERLAGRVIITSDNPRGEQPDRIMEEIAAGLTGAGGTALMIADRREAIAHALNEAAEGDLVLIAGKGSETYQEISGVQQPFDDREVARELAGAGSRDEQHK